MTGFLGSPEVVKIIRIFYKSKKSCPTFSDFYATDIPDNVWFRFSVFNPTAQLNIFVLLDTFILVYTVLLLFILYTYRFHSSFVLFYTVLFIIHPLNRFIHYKSYFMPFYLLFILLYRFIYYSNFIAFHLLFIFYTVSFIIQTL